MALPFSSNDTNTIEYYTYYILLLIIGWVSLIIFKKIIRGRQDAKKIQDMNKTIDFFAQADNKIIIHDKLDDKESSLRFKYILVVSLIKSAVWMKAPYLFAYYNRVHLFDREQIGVLYAIDNVSSLVTGPIFGILCDMYGRKKFCIIYCICLIVQISLRLTGNQPLAYLAQTITGFCSCLVELAFESWLNFEASMMFKKDIDSLKLKNAYLREIYTTQTNIDCYCSLVLTGVATVVYVNFLKLFFRCNVE